MTAKETTLHIREVMVMYGHESLTDEDVLASIIDSQKAKTIAKKLIKEYGDLASVLDAPCQSFQAYGVGRDAALRIKSFPVIAQRYFTSAKAQQYVITPSTTAMREYVASLFIGDTVEKFVLISLDCRCGIIRATMMSKGIVNGSEISLRKIVEQAITDRAYGVVIAHNHPSGSLHVSSEDIQSTDRVRNVLKAMGIKLLDHVIVAKGDTLSLADEGHLAAA